MEHMQINFYLSLKVGFGIKYNILGYNLDVYDHLARSEISVFLVRTEKDTAKLCKVFKRMNLCHCQTFWERLYIYFCTRKQ